jgi:cytochrome c biogenesis protein CcmG/thiol:disulfide interchange protein DsbE
MNIKAIATIFGLIIIIGFFWLLGWAVANREAATSRSGLTRINKPAPPINLVLFNGETFKTEDPPEKPIVVNFWASWCPPCRDEAPMLEKTWRKYSEEVVFLGVAIQDSDTAAESYIAEFDITYPNGLDLDGKITVDYGVVGLPVTFLIDPDGTINKRWVGALKETTLNQWLEEITTANNKSIIHDLQRSTSYIAQ